VILQNYDIGFMFSINQNWSAD